MVAVPDRELMSRAILKVKQQYMVMNVKGEKEGEDKLHPRFLPSPIQRCCNSY